MATPDEIRKHLIPLLVLSNEIEKFSRLRPSAMMMPVDFHVEVESIYGMPVVRGDRFALMYEPDR